MQFDAIVENLIQVGDCFFGVKTGQLFKLNNKLELLGEEKQFLDIKLLCKFGEQHVFTVTYDNKIGVFDLNLKLLAKIPLQQNVTCAKESSSKVFMGTDTGSIIVFAQEDISFLEFLQQEILNQFEQMNQKLFVSQMTNAVDGDVIRMFSAMGVGDQEAIAIKLNTGRNIVFDKLMKMGLKIAVE